jgi:hypothetical protein
MHKIQTEKRKARRVALQMPIKVRVPNGGEPSERDAETRDLSERGVFFFVDAEVGEGSLIELVMMLPPQVTLTEKQWVCCQARVVRVEAGDKEGSSGIAAVIENCAVLPEA